MIIEMLLNKALKANPLETKAVLIVITEIGKIKIGIKDHSVTETINARIEDLIKITTGMISKESQESQKSNTNSIQNLISVNII